MRGLVVALVAPLLACAPSPAVPSTKVPRDPPSDATAAGQDPADPAEPTPPPLTGRERTQLRGLCVRRMTPKPTAPTGPSGEPVPRGVPTAVPGSADADLKVDCERQEYWRRMQATYPDEESLYCILTAQAEACGSDEDALSWARQRTTAFPDSRDAWFFLAVEWFRPLFPNPGSGVPFNEDLPPETRRERATQALQALERAKRLSPDDRIVLVWTELSHNQRRLSYARVKRPKTRQERLDAIAARAEEMAAWNQRKAICDLDGLRTCRSAKDTQSCCPPAPYTKAELERDAKERATLEGS